MNENFVNNDVVGADNSTNKNYFIIHIVYIGIIILMVILAGFYFVNNNKEHNTQLETLSSDLNDLNLKLEKDIPPVLSYLGFPCGGQWNLCLEEVLSNIEEIGQRSTEIEAVKAIQGYKKQAGPSVPAGELTDSRDCLEGLKKGGDGSYCDVKKPEEPELNGVSGVAEIYFEIPAEYKDASKFAYIAHIELGCKSGINILEETKFLEWKKIGTDLPSADYKPDGTFGYLSCPYDGLSEMIIDLPVNAHDGKVGIRLVEGEVTAQAKIDRVYLQAVKK